MKISSKGRRSKNPNATLKKKLWKVFARFVKERDDWTCFTCGRKVSGASANAGHFIPKAVGGLALYFHEDNVHCQCAYCNLALEGNHYIYGKKLGERKVKELYALKSTIIKNYPFEEKIAHYERETEKCINEKAYNRS